MLLTIYVVNYLDFSRVIDHVGNAHYEGDVSKHSDFNVVEPTTKSVHVKVIFKMASDDHYRIYIVNLVFNCVFDDVPPVRN